MKPGTTFVNRNPGSPSRLWIIAAASSSIIAFPVKPFRDDGRDDDTVILTAANHPGIRGSVVVSYEEGRPIPVATFEGWVRDRMVDLQQPLDEGTLHEIQQGALKSDFTPGKFVAEIQQELAARNTRS